MKKTLILITILVFASFVRLYNLDINPPAAYGDEQSFAWNAWNILKQGTDEYGTRYPLQFKAFDDYKAPIPVYSLVPFINFLGLNTYAVRLPVVIASVLTIFVLYLLARKLFSENIGLLAAFLLAISPWHIHLSRGYFESTIALLFIVSAVYFFVKAENRITNLYLAAVFFVLTLYTYFTPRIMLILFIPFLIFWGRKWLFKNKKQLIYFLLIIIVLCLPLFYVTFWAKGLSRIDKLTSTRNSVIEKMVISDLSSYQGNSNYLLNRIFHNKYYYWLREITNGYLEHFSLNFWYLYGDDSLRYFLGNMGMFYLVELPFTISGIYYLFSKKRKVFWLVLGWLLVAPIPASLSGRPFAVRSLAMLPPAILINAAGLNFIWKKITDIKYGIVFKYLIATFLVLCFGYYFIRYHSEYPVYAATWWGWENKAAIDLAIKNKDNYDQIFISNFYSGMDLALAYYLAYDPQQFREAKNNIITLADNRQFIKLGKFYIGSLDIDQKRKSANIIPPKSLYIGRPEEVDSNENITAPVDGRILFKIYRTN